MLFHDDVIKLSALLTLCAGNSPATGEFPSQRPVKWSYAVFFDLCLNKRLSKQSWGWWFETRSRSLWPHSNVWRECLNTMHLSKSGFWTIRTQLTFVLLHQTFRVIIFKSKCVCIMTTRIHESIILLARNKIMTTHIYVSDLIQWIHAYYAIKYVNSISS